MFIGKIQTRTVHCKIPACGYFSETLVKIRKTHSEQI
jgi:hypothetical protein